MKCFVNINHNRDTVDYIFYDTYTDIYRMNFSLPEYVTNQEIQIDSDSIRLKITIPKYKGHDLIDFSKDYIIDNNDENTPCKIVEFSTDPEEELYLPFERYYHPMLKDAIAYTIDGNLLLVEFPIY